MPRALTPGSSAASSAFFRTGYRGEETPAEPRRPRRLRRIATVTATCVAGAAVYAALGPLSSAAADPSANDWLRLRTCESGNNYRINTGNAHYGAYQFDLSTWRSVGGAGYPYFASPAEQDARALILYRERGWQPWQCAGIVGLRNDGDAGSGRTSDIVVPVSGTPAPIPVPAPTHGTPSWPGPQYFSFGDHSTTIKRFQDQLHARGVFPVGTGDFGPNTLAAVNRLQAQNGLRQTGILGPVTWALAWTGRVQAAGRPAVAPTGPTARSAPVWPGPQYFSVGDHSATIKRFQDQLHARGVFPVGTGDFGPNTLAAVNRLQAQNGLRQTGLLGPVTWKLAWTGRY